MQQAVWMLYDEAEPSPDHDPGNNTDRDVVYVCQLETRDVTPESSSPIEDVSQDKSEQIGKPVPADPHGMPMNRGMEEEGRQPVPVNHTRSLQPHKCGGFRRLALAASAYCRRQ